MSWSEMVIDVANKSSQATAARRLDIGRSG
jgi:hypothetical protein